MTYEEIKTRLTQCETKLQGLKQTKPTSGNVANYNLAVQKLEVLKESLSKKLSEAEKTAFVNGQATEYEDEKELNKLKDNPDVKSIKTASGKKIKEQQGVTFSVEETSAIAKKTGKAVAMGLKALGDEVAHMKAKKIEENSFEIYVEYKNGSDDQFSFYISDDTLHLVDFSFDKELVDVGVKPSGEAIVNVDVLSNELQKHWKSMKEGMSDQEFADAQENDRLNKHPEKDTIIKIKALLAKEKASKLKEITKEGEGDDHHYIKVSRRDYKKAMSILNNAAEPSFVKMDVVDDDGAGNVIIYFMFNEFADDFDVEEREAFMYDAVMDLQAQGIDIPDHSAELDEASDYARRRQRESDYFVSKKDKPAKAYKEPSNDYFARRKKESDYNEDVDAQQDGGDLDVGHQDDEPDMLMKDIYDIATYAAKLHKMLKKYNDFDGEVDFPHWWQKKVTLARDYISAAQHYLEAEEKQPALDQLALESQSHPVMVQQRIAHAKKAKEKEKKTVKEDWGGSDQRAMNQQIHKALGEPTKMPSPFDDKLEYAVQDAVDFHWDDWPEYQQDREGLYTQAKRAYLRAMFRDTFDKMVRMFEPADEATKGEEDKFHKNLDKLVHKTFGHSSDEKKKEIKEDRFVDSAMEDLEQVIRNLAHTAYISEDEAIEMAIRKLEAMLDGRDDLDENINEGTELYNRNGIQIKRFSGGQRGVMVQITIGDKYIVVPAEEYPFLVRAMQSVQEDLKDMSRQYPRSKNMQEGFGKTKKAYDLVVNKMKELAKVYKSGDTSVIAQLKDLTAKKKELEKMLEKQAGGIGAGQELDPNASETKINEEKATCCGKCGRVHVKGTKCKTPYLKGKDHCRYN